MFITIIFKDLFLRTVWPIKAKRLVEYSKKKIMKVYINAQGHMTKMAAMAINSKNPLKIFFSRIRRPVILKLGMKHQGEELYKVFINHDLGMTLA